MGLSLTAARLCPSTLRDIFPRAERRAGQHDEEQEIAWHTARDNARDAGDPDDEAAVCEHERAHAHANHKAAAKDASPCPCGPLRMPLGAPGRASGAVAPVSIRSTRWMADSQKACQACI